MTGTMPKSILFACNHNMVRSPMAEAMMRARFPGGAIAVHSCGIDMGPPDGFTMKVMEEIGIDMGGHESRDFSAVAGMEFDLVVAFSDGSLEVAKGLFAAGIIEHWPVYDPALTSENREMRLDAYRGVRDAIAGLLDAKFAEIT